MQRQTWRRRMVPSASMVVAMALVACAADPSARRTRRVMSEQDELEIGRQAAEQVEQLMGFSGSAELNAYVQRIGQRLVKHSSRSHIPHEFHVVDMKEPNAFALPGGYIYVSRGLLSIMNSEDELAAVIGHEIGHVAGRHSAQREAKSRGWIPLQILAGIGGAAASVISPGLGSAVAGAGQLPAALAVASYSRKQEKEADRLGQQYAAAEGWDPAALADSMDALTREQELHGGRDPNQMSFFDTHPTTPERSREGREYAATLPVAPPNRIAVDRDGFLEMLDGLVLGDSVRAGVFVESRFIHPPMKFTIDFPNGWTHENGASAVLAYPGDESAALALQVVAEGDDPSVVADEIASEVELDERSEPMQIHGLPAVWATTRVAQNGQEIRVGLTWIAKDGLVFQVLGATTPTRWAEYRPVFESVAKSFRTMSEDDLKSVREQRLRLVEARPKETVQQIVERGNSVWPADKVAAANAIQESDAFRGGETIKISRSEPYRAPAESP